MRRPLCSIALALAATALHGAVLGAQTLRVRVVEAGTAQPLPGVIVEVLRADDASGALVAAAVTTADGGRMLPLGAAGRYRVRARRIGFVPFLSEPVALSAGETRELPIHMPARRVELAAVTVAGERRCDARAVAADARVATVWEEVRKALTVSALSLDDRPAELRARAFERHLDAERRERRLLLHPPRATASRPFAARGAADLSRGGYVRGEGAVRTFHAPDERVLLSDEFARDHCFSLVAGEGVAAGLLGLAFTPVPGRRVAEIAGVLWLDPASAELRHLDFWYVDRELPQGASGAGGAGGQVVFERLPDGGWSPVAWRLRMPTLREVQAPGLGFEPGFVSLVLGGFVETGAVAELPHRAAVARAPTLAAVLAPYLALTAPARLAGVVHDSLARAPLAGARVQVVPTPDPAWTEENASPLAALAPSPAPQLAVTDERGRFALDSLPAGYYRVHVAHAALDSAGLSLPSGELRLAPGARDSIALAVPPFTSFEAGCTASVGHRLGRRGIVFGTVRRAADGAPLLGADVVARWTPAGASPAEGPTSLPFATGGDGMYRLCNVPLAGPLAIAVTARVERDSSETVTLVVGAGRDVVRRDLVVPTSGGEVIAPVAGQLAALRAVTAGRVVDTFGAPLPDATVRLVAAATADDAREEPAPSLVARVRTDSAGGFRLARLPLGAHELEVRRVGFHPARRRITLRAGDTTHVVVTLAPAPEPAASDAAPPPAGSLALAAFEERQRLGGGQFLTAPELARWPTMTSLFGALRDALVVVEVRAGMPGLFPGDGAPGAWVGAVAKVKRHGGKLYGECALALYLDGERWSYTDLAPLTPADLVALEVYPQLAPVPARYVPADGACGAVLLWTAQAP